jgi:[protein-PII] uridylyltransferase
MSVDSPLSHLASGGVEASNADAAFVQRHRVICDRVMNGASGAESLAAMTDLVDGFIIGRYSDAARGSEARADAALRRCCVAALGGYGRRELAPYSDIDLMFVVHPWAEEDSQSFVRAVLHPLWDRGFRVGHSVRTIAECVELALTDATVKTSMMEARFLAGSAELFQEFLDRYGKKVVAVDKDGFLDRKVEERRREYEKFGETVYLLEPNIKKSKGGLRDLHLLQWAGQIRFQAPTIRDLCDRGILSRADALALMDAREFLWRVRALLHAHAGTAQEILTFDEQVWLARHFEFRDLPHALAVEQFMQQYYRHTGALHECCTRFIERCRTVPLWRRMAQLLPVSRVDGQFVVRGGVLAVPDRHRAEVLDSPASLLRLFDVARERDLRIAPALLEDIHRHGEHVAADAYRTPEIGRIFMRILAGPRAATTLDAMHRARVLEKLVPAMGAVRGLMQFNQYHKYTVDEHSLLAVGRVEALSNDAGPLGDVYRAIKRKDILHLAVLMHDLGKGQGQLRHSETGKRLAEETAERLGFDEQETRTLSFLVHRHLLMAHTAFRRDPNDDTVVFRFAREVGTPAVLRKLLALTAADIAAVGPGVLTKWKESLLLALYARTMPQVSGDRDTVPAPERLTRLVEDVCRQPILRPHDGRAAQDDADRPWVEAQLQQFPVRYLQGAAPTRLAAHLAAVRSLRAGEVIVDAEYDRELGACEYAVITRDDVDSGIFSKIAGVLAGSGLQILDAQILTRADGIVIDTFHVADLDYQGEPPPDRRRTIGDRIVAVLKGWEEVDDVLRRGTRLKLVHPLPKTQEPTEVRIDNETSDEFTIIDIFADDRLGLLYEITRAIFRLGLSIHAARISTMLDQACDVFYVTDRTGMKVQEQAQLERVRERLIGTIEAFLQRKVA